jgi:hypothetical protein
LHALHAEAIRDVMPAFKHHSPSDSSAKDSLTQWAA